MKEISKKQINLLVKNGILKNTKKGYVDKNGEPSGFYRTVNKTFIQDKYIDIANNLM